MDSPSIQKKYKNERFIWKKEPLIIVNKFCIEWGEKPYNFISLEALHRIISLLKNNYQLIYFRATERDIVIDHNTIIDLRDFELLSKFPEVVTIQKLHRENRDLSFNTLALMVFANCRKFISVQGGNSVLSSYFGGTNIIFAKKGKELINGDHGHFFLFSKARIFTRTDYRSFLFLIEKVYCSKNPWLYRVKEWLDVKICSLKYYFNFFKLKFFTS